MRVPRWPGAGVLLAVLAGGAALVVVMHRTAPAPLASTIPVGMDPQEVAVDSRTGHAFVTNLGDSTVSMVDTRSGAIVRTVAVVPAAIDVVADPRTRRAFVGGDGTVSVLDTRSGAVLRTVALDHAGRDVSDVGVAARANRIVILLGNSSSPSSDSGPSILTFLDARSGAILHQIPMNPYAHAVAMDEHTGRTFVTNPGDGTVSVVDTASGRVLRTVPVGAGPWAVAVDEQTARAFVTHPADGAVSVLDARSGAVVRTVPVGGGPTEVSVDARTGHAFVVLHPGLCVLDARTGRVLYTAAVGATPSRAVVQNPRDVVIDPRTSRAYVINPHVVNRTIPRPFDSVGVLDARNGRVLGRLPVGRGPVALAEDEATHHLFVVNTEGGSPAGTSATTDNAWGWVPQGLRPWLSWRPHQGRPSPAAPPGSVTMLDISRV